MTATSPNDLDEQPRRRIRVPTRFGPGTQALGLHRDPDFWAASVDAESPEAADHWDCRIWAPTPP